MRTLLHIGMAKTGSTALQDCLLRSHDYLLGQGVLFPKNADDVNYNNHRLLAYLLLNFEELPRHMLQKDEQPADLAARYDNFIATLSAQIATAKPDCLVLSSESLFRGFSQGKGDRLREELGKLGAGVVDVVVYLRRPSEHYLSLLQQKLKASHHVRPPVAQKYCPKLQQCGAAFGAEHIFPRAFNRATLVDGDIVSDFCRWHLAAHGVDRSRLAIGGRPNDTIGAEAMDILRRYRWDFDHDLEDRYTRGSQALIHALRAAEDAISAPRPRLKPEIADLVDYGTADPLKLRDGYGVVFPGYDYTRLEHEGPLPKPPRRRYSLNELVEIDARIRAALLAQLTSAPWTGAAPERGEWIAGLRREAG